MELIMKLAKSTTTKFVLNPILTAMLGLSVSLSAQAAVNSVDQDESMTVVTVNRSTQSISDIAATVLVIEEEQIAEQAKSGVDFKALLANLIPSLDMGSQSRTNSGQNMRGRKTLVMIDGISLNSSRGVSRQFDSINPFNIARIEVVSGASAMYGGGSTGGVINIITKKGRDADGVSETWLGAKSGFNKSDDLEWQVAQAVSTSSDKMDARLAVSYVDTGATYDSNGDMVLQDVTQTSSQFVSQLDIMANMGFNISSTKRLELLAQYYDSGQDSDYGVDYGTNLMDSFDPSKKITMKEGYDLDNQAESVRSMLAVNYSDSDFFNQTMNLQLFYRTESLRFNPFPDLASYGYITGIFPGVPTVGDNYVTFSASEQKTDVVGAKFVFTSEQTDNLNLVYGADLDFETFSATQSMYDFKTARESNGLDLNKIGETGRYPDVDNISFAGFLQAAYEVTPRLSVNAGARYQYTKTKVSDFVSPTQQYMILLGHYDSADAIEGGEKDYSNVLFNAGSVFKINKEQQTWFNFSQGFEIPDPAKYYGKGQYTSYNGLPGYGNDLLNGISVASSPLEGVKTNAVELGWRANTDSISTQLVAYASLSDKELKYNSRTQALDVLDHDERIYGVEGMLDYYLTSELTVGSSFNYIVRDVKSDSDWKKKDVDYASPSKATAYVAWQSDSVMTRLPVS
jgi:iron complex outermembrane receptor protein